MISNEEQLFWTQTLCYSSGELTVKIPFVCFRCGKCCRKVSVHLEQEPAEIPTIANFLGLRIEDFVSQYVGKPWKPCTFLSSLNACTIYAVRPSACRSYPLHDFGDWGIGCPGYKQVKRVKSAIGQGVGYGITNQREGKTPGDLEWKLIYRKFLRAIPSPEMIQAFITINNIPRESTI